MIKRMLLALTFVAAFTTVSVIPADTAEAWRRWWRRPYVSYYYRPRVPYRSTYYYGYGPRFYNPYYGYYYGPDYYYYGPRGRMAFRIGW